MARPERMLPPEQGRRILSEGSYGVLSTVSADGIPYGVPVNYVYVPEDNALYIHCARSGRKLNNLRENDRVSFAVVGSQRIIEEHLTTHYESAIVAGHARLVEDPALKAEALRRLCQRLTPSAMAVFDSMTQKCMPAVAVLRVDIISVSAKRNQDE